VANVLEMQRLCESREIGFVLIPFPYRTPLPPEMPRDLAEDFASLHQVLHRVAAEHSIPHVDLPKMREEHGDDYADYFIDLVHPSESGHRYMAEQIHATLLREELLPKP
jgi:lysophospholipase L1-like esterase